jgi:hypothetical protein
VEYEEIGPIESAKYLPACYGQISRPLPASGWCERIYSADSTQSQRSETRETGNNWRTGKMKPRHAAALALVMLLGCGPDIATIDRANERAERAAERSQAAQLRAEHSEQLTEEIAMKTRDEETALCGTACDSCHTLTGASRERYEFT